MPTCPVFAGPVTNIVLSGDECAVAIGLIKQYNLNRLSIDEENKIADMVWSLDSYSSYAYYCTELKSDCKYTVYKVSKD